MPGTFAVHFSEVALKGKNRPEFVRMLRRNIGRSLWGLDSSTQYREGRFIVSVEGDADEAARRLSRVFGVVWISKAEVVPRTYLAVLEATLRLARESSEPSFKIEARRTDKSFPMTSGELAVSLGARVVEETGKGVDLSDPGVAIHVDVLKDSALVYAKKTRGPGGLPVGSAGKVVHLFSGGIDSPVAAWLLMKRGCRPIYLHFYLAPGPEYAMQSKVVKQLKLLSLFGGKSTLVLVPFAEYQVATIGRAGELEPSLFRRFMRMTAEVLAPRFGAKAVSTGDSLSQAASQTVWNLGNFDQGSSLPILRPLLTYDKEEVVTLAKQIGTYESSLEEYRDCCAIVTRRPRTRLPAELISRFASELSFAELVPRSLEGATLVSYSPSTDKLKASPLNEALSLHALTEPPERSLGS